MARILKILIAFLLLCGTAYGATYYVRTDGNDSTCDGTQNEAAGDGTCAWLTVAYAATQVSATNTISVGDGTYTESQIVLATGVSLTATNQTDPPSVTIQPSGSLGTSSGFLSLQSGVGTNGNQTISYLELDGVNGANVARVGIWVKNRDNVTITYNNIHDFKGVSGSYGMHIEGTAADGLLWYNELPADMQAPGTDTNLDAAWPANPVQNLTISYNTMSDNGYKGTGDSLSNSIRISHLKNSVIHHNTISCLGAPIGQADAWLWNVDIYNNDLTMTNFSDRSSYAIEIWNFRNGCEIYNNTSNAAFSLPYGKETYVHDNTINVGVKRGLAIEFTMQSYGGIYNNYVGSTGANQSGIFIGMSRHTQNENYVSKYVVVRKNVVYNINNALIRVSAICCNAASNTTYILNSYVYNNTLDTNRSSAGYGMIRVEQDDVGSGFSNLEDVYIKNNVIIDSTNEYAGKTIGSVVNVIVDYNLFNNNNTDDWLSTTDTNTVLTDPTFTNENGGTYASYTPASGSNIIDAGTYLTEVNDGDDCTGGGCTAMIVDDVGWFLVGDYVWVDATTDFLEQITAINYTTNTLTLNAAHDHQDGNDVYLAYSATQGLLGSSVDLGAIEYAMFISGAAPIDDATNVNTDTTLSWTNPTGYTHVDVYAKEGTGDCTFTVDNRLKDDQDISSVTNADLISELGMSGELDTDADICWRVDVNHAGGTETGIVYNFSTAPGPPAPVASQPGEVWSPYGSKYKWRQ